MDLAYKRLLEGNEKFVTEKLKLDPHYLKNLHSSKVRSFCG